MLLGDDAGTGGKKRTKGKGRRKSQLGADTEQSPLKNLKKESSPNLFKLEERLNKTDRSVADDGRKLLGNTEVLASEQNLAAANK